MPKFVDRIQHAWNAFFNKDPTEETYINLGPSTYQRPDRVYNSVGDKRSLINTVYNRIAMDVAALTFHHIQTDEKGRFKSVLKTSLDERFNLEANLDQTGRMMIQDLVFSMCDEGCVALAPVETDDDPEEGNTFKIMEVRVAQINQWYPEYVQMTAYNQRTGLREQLTMRKSVVAIIENPFYAVMNEPNSTIKRLIRKISLLDYIDEQNGSGKLNLIVQLPYSIRNDLRKQQAEERRKDIETQLVKSKYGIAYTDSTEHVTQLNRAIDNNLAAQVDKLTQRAYSELGMSPKVFDGTATEEEQLLYQNTTIEPIASAIVNEVRRKWLSKTARSRGQDFKFYSDPFRLVPVSKLAELADKFTRNEIMTSNEVRQIVGMIPMDDPKADMLWNSNINHGNDEMAKINGTNKQMSTEENQNEEV